MPVILINFFGTIPLVVFCGGVGGIAGIAMAYAIVTLKSGYSFSYRLALILGIVGAIYGLASSIREVWLR